MFTTPEEAEFAFYDAMRKADLGLMMRVWADEEVVCIHPGGMRTIGHDALQSTWQQIFTSGPIEVTPLQPTVITSVMSSVHVLIEQITVDTPQGRQSSLCYTTNVFHKGPSGWKMILHHASQAPQDAGLFDLQDRPDTLH
jgi:ketosteroid isomerase-like protein